MDGAAAGPPRAIDLGTEPTFRVGSATIDPVSRDAEFGGGSERLQPQNLKVLIALARQRAKVVTRDELIACCWDGRFVGDDVINRSISTLRQFAERAGGFSIETIPRAGYRLFEAPSRSRTNRRLAAILGVVLCVIAISAAFVPQANRKHRPAPASLAVMPFTDLTPSHDNAYFADGLTEEIRNSLSGEAGILVIGRTSTGLLGTNAGFEEARRRLGVSHLLEGSVRRNGDALRMSVRLVDAKTGRQIWSQEFDRPIGDVFAMEDEIGEQIASRLRGTLTGAGRRPTRRTDSKVYDLYLTAVSLERDLTYPSAIRAQALLKRAIQLDPTYAPAYAELAGIESFIPFNDPSGRFQDVDAARVRGQAYARRALELDPNLAEAYRAMVPWEEDPRQQLAHVQRAIALDPGNSDAWYALGAVQTNSCRPGDAIGSNRRAAAAEPLLLWPRSALVSLLLETNRNEEAADVVRDFSAISPKGVDHLALQASVAWHSGDLSKKVRLQLAMLKADPNPGTKSGLTLAFRTLGLPGKAAEYIPETERPLMVPLIRGDYRMAAAGAMKRGNLDWDASSSLLSGSVLALLRAGRSHWIMRSFDARYRSIEDFDRRMQCKAVVYYAPHLVTALRQQGRNREANRLLQLANSHYRQGVEAGYRDFVWQTMGAELHALSSQRDAAIASLDRASRNGWLDQIWPLLSLSDPEFDPIRSDARFRAIERHVATELRRERAELAQSNVPIAS